MEEYESDSRKGDPNSGVTKPGTKYYMNLIRADERIAPKFKGRVLEPREADRAKRKDRKA